MTERRCRYRSRSDAMVCGALIVEGACRTPMHHPRDRAKHEQYDYGHEYDGWVCERGHEVSNAREQSTADR